MLILKACRGPEEQLRLAIGLGQEKPLVKGTAPLAKEAPGTKGSWKEIEAWHHEAGEDTGRVPGLLQ